MLTRSGKEENEIKDTGGPKVGCCIFCRIETKNEPIEHVALEGLFGHQPFVDGREHQEVGELGDYVGLKSHKAPPSSRPRL